MACKLHTRFKSSKFNVKLDDETKGIEIHHLHILPLEPTFLIECNILLAAIQDDLVAADISGMLYEGIDHPACKMLQKTIVFPPAEFHLLRLSRLYLCPSF